ncbi:MAG TPA: [protein-PII] uridylyltransferase [Myxococcota bacterium]|nr:[protein-PII] uridylyltransferase [Myxococcota bacterium]
MQPVCEDFFAPTDRGRLGPSSQYLNPSVRSYLDAVRAHLLELHDSGAPARRVNEEHAELIDRLVRKLFRLAEDRYFENFPRLNFRFAVVAVGGYGRRELSLGSDVDLLFLYRGKENPYVETITETISTRLWDARVVVGAATRSVSECLRVGKEDLSTLTSYLDGRFLVGDPALFAELDRDVRAHLKEHSEAFIDAKLAEQAKRHEAFGESLYLLQPNLKESVGGLRDFHTALWIARAAIWEVRRAEHLRVHGFIDADEERELQAALEFLWRVRNQLHRRGRKDDRLHYEAQAQLAEYLGLVSGVRGVEVLMRSYYLHARAIQRVSRRAIDHARQVATQRRAPQSQAPHPVAEGFVLSGGRLEIPASSLLEERPMRLLAAFAIAQHHDVELSARAQRLIRQHLHRIDDAFRVDPEAAAFFRQILGAPTRVYRTLQTMDEVGVLGAYVPEFAHLVGMWQQDMYHTYTVDIHSLFLVEQLRRIQKGRYRAELQLATELMREVRSPVLLYLGCILHDIGKGHGGGHSGKGAAMIPGLARRLGLSSEEAAILEFLVQHHLTMSAMAEQRDVHDPRLILRLAKLCGSRLYLRLLYLVTVADIRSVSPVAWTSWKAGLLERLYRNTAEWLEAGEEVESAEQFLLERAMSQAAATAARAVEMLAQAGIEKSNAEALLDQMPRRYLLENSPEEVAAHMRTAFAFLADNPPARVAPFRPVQPNARSWGLVVVAPDRPGLFATLAGVLSGCGHNILAASAYTTRDGLALDLFDVDPIGGGPEEHELERARIEKRLAAVLAGEAEIPPPPRTSLPSVLRVQEPQVRIENDDSDFYSIIDVEAMDRPGLLYDISRALFEQGLSLVAVRASTRASRATDAFYVTTLDGDKVVDAELQRRVQEAILRAIGQGGE